MKKRIQAIKKWWKKQREVTLFVVLVVTWIVFLSLIVFVISNNYQAFSSFFLPFADTGTKCDIQDARSLLLILLALLGVPLVATRTVMAGNQLETSQKQLETSQKQLEVSNEQIEQANEEIRERDFKEWQRNLFSGNRTQEYNAIELLWRLAQSQPEGYHIRVMNTLSDFLVEKSEVSSSPTAIALKRLTNQDDRYKKTEGQKIKEIAKDYRIRLQSLRIHVGLAGADFSRSVLQEVIFSDDVDLTGASFEFSDLLDTEFKKCNLSDAKFNWAMLNNINLSNSLLAGAHFNKTFLREANFLSGTRGEGISCENISMAGNNEFRNIDIDKMFKQNNEGLSEDEWKAERQEKWNLIMESHLTPYFDIPY